MHARADSGAETLNFSPTNVTEVLREACHQGSALAEARQIGFQPAIRGSIRRDGTQEQERHPSPESGTNNEAGL